MRILTAPAREFFGLLSMHRRLIWEMSRREISERYSGHVLGRLWAVGHPLALIGVAGAETADHVQRYLTNGASAVHIATGAMTNPLVGVEIKRQLEFQMVDSK